MSSLSATKTFVFHHCFQLLQDRISRLQKELQALVESAGNETKSTAGDKYETGKAMLHIEQDNVRQQLKDANAQLLILRQAEGFNATSIIALGSLIRMGDKLYFLCTSLGKLQIQDKMVFALSCQSPMGQMLMGRSVGDSVTFNDASVLIEEIV